MTDKEVTNKIEEVCRQVRNICKDANLEFLFITEGRSEWSANNNEHIREVARYHKQLESSQDQ